MIIEVLFELVKGVVTFILGLMPDWTPIDFNAIATGLVGWWPDEVADVFAWINYYVPLREALLLVLTGLGIWVAVLAFKVVVDVLTKLHILGG